MSEILVKKRKVRERERRGFCWEIVAFSFLILDRYHLSSQDFCVTCSVPEPRAGLTNI